MIYSYCSKYSKNILFEVQIIIDDNLYSGIFGNPNISESFKKSSCPVLTVGIAQGHNFKVCYVNSLERNCNFGIHFRTTIITCVRGTIISIHNKHCKYRRVSSRKLRTNCTLTNCHAVEYSKGMVVYLVTFTVHELFETQM